MAGGTSTTGVEVDPHSALGWWTPGVDAIYRVGELVQMHTIACVTRHFLLASKYQNREAISPLLIYVW